MGLARWQATIVDEQGDVQAGASVTVRREVAGSPLAQLYSDREGTTLVGNPVTADSNGFAYFYTDGGAYRITATKNTFSIVWRYVPIGTAQEYDATDTSSLVQQVDAGYALQFESEIVAPPSSGCVRFNNADLSAATEAYIDVTNLGGSDIEDRLLELYSALRTVKDTIIFQNPSDDEIASFRIDGAVAVNSPVEYVTLTISQHNGETSFTAGDRLNMQRERAGASGSNAGLTYAFNVATSGDPGAGYFLLNNAAPVSATAVHLSDTDGDGNDVSAFLAIMDDSTSILLRGVLIIRDQSTSSTYAIYSITGASTDQGTYWQIAVTHLASNGTLSENCSVEFYRTGDKGTDGTMSGPGAVTEAGQIAVFSDGTGATLEGGTDGNSPATNVTLAGILDCSALASASETAAGVVENATAAEARAATPGKALTTDVLDSATEIVTLTDAATIALDWSAGINFDVTITTDRVLGNPTNGEPGQWRTVLVKSDSDSPTSALTFGNQYGGEPPTLDDITTTKWYLLAIYCASASHFIVTAVDGSAP